jgi:hypothetical protein
MPKATSSCDPNIEHVIYDHEEIVHWIGNVYGRLVYIEKEGHEGHLIGVHACEEDGELIPNGLVLVLDNGIWIRQKNLNEDRLGQYIDMDGDGRIKVAT